MPVFLSNKARDATCDPKKYRTINVFLALTSSMLLYLVVFAYPIPRCDMATVTDVCLDTVSLGMLLGITILFQTGAYFVDLLVVKTGAPIFGFAVLFLVVSTYYSQ